MTHHRTTYKRDAHGYIRLALLVFIGLCILATAFGIGFWIGRVTA